MKCENLCRAHKLYIELEEMGFILNTLEEDCIRIGVQLRIQTKDMQFFHDLSLDGREDKEFIELFIEHLKAKQDRMEKELEDLL